MAACGVTTKDTTSSGEGRGLSKMSTEDEKFYLKEHLRECKFQEKRYNKLLTILTSLRKDSKNADEFLEKFANKCYHRENDRKKAKQEAKRFLESVFGKMSEIFSLGPERAIASRVKQIYGQSQSDDSKEDSPDGTAYVRPERIKPPKKPSTGVLATLKKGLGKGKDEEKAEEKWKFKLGRFMVGPFLGEGGTATVFLAKDTKDNKECAIKILKPKYANAAQKEIEILGKLNHPNIISMHKFFPKLRWDGQKTSAFVIELANGGELIEYMMYTGKFEEKLARWFMQKLVNGIAYCHKQKLVHRDLKHDNCLLDDKFNLKITDFGFARNFDESKDTMRTAIGTPQYAAPEILSRKLYNVKVDIFSMGVMLFITLSGSQPWRKADKNGDKWYQMWMKAKSKFWKYHQERNNIIFSKDAKKLLEGMLAHRPKDRYSMEEVQDSHWLNDEDKCTDAQAAQILQDKKKKVDAMKRNKSLEEESNRRGVQRDVDVGGAVGSAKDGEDQLHKQLKLPLLSDNYKLAQRLPLTSFKTKDKPKMIMDMIQKVVAELRGEVTKTYGQEFPALGDDDDETRLECDFELRFYPIAKVEPKKNKDGKKRDDGSSIIMANVALYRETDDAKSQTVVVFTPKRSERGSEDERQFVTQDSKLYLPRVFNDVMTRIGFLRTDVVRLEDDGQTEHSKNEDIIAQSGFGNSVVTSSKKKRASGAVCN